MISARQKRWPLFLIAAGLLALMTTLLVWKLSATDWAQEGSQLVTFFQLPGMRKLLWTLLWMGIISFVLVLIFARLQTRDGDSSDRGYEMWHETKGHFQALIIIIVWLTLSSYLMKIF